MPNHDLSQRALTHDRLAEQYEHISSPYDLYRRLDVLINEFLDGEDLKGKHVLDAGCGTGRGTERMNSRGAQVTALDIGPNLVNLTRARYPCQALIASVSELPFPDNTFDVVFSTEVIEHTPDPLASALEMYRVLKPNGHLVLSTPVWLWQWPVRIASLLHLRPFDGLENFLRPQTLRQTLQASGAVVEAHRGIHLLPFQIKPLLSFIRYMDRYGKLLLPIMINQCIHCVKPA
jgi:2-polyprenyl-3-methyl-5-hydroxy-6-metoxy-1,4-benzoquinol methylase